MRPRILSILVHRDITLFVAAHAPYKRCDFVTFWRFSGPVWKFPAQVGLGGTKFERSVEKIRRFINSIFVVQEDGLSVHQLSVLVKYSAERQLHWPLLVLLQAQALPAASRSQQLSQNISTWRFSPDSLHLPPCDTLCKRSMPDSPFVANSVFVPPLPPSNLSEITRNKLKLAAG